MKRLFTRRRLRCAAIAASSFICLGASARWHEFKGLYVNMPVSEIKKMGFTCEPGKPFDVCKPPAGDKRFSTIGGAPVRDMGVVIDRGKVYQIRLETTGAYWEDLKAAMIKNYGKPKKDSRSSVLWDRGGAEFISAVVSKGIVEVNFSYSEFDSEKRIKERAAKADKDF